MTSRPLRIGELAESGLTRDALRYYERQGLLPRARRTVGGFREYDGSAVDRVRFIKQAQAHGLTLREHLDLCDRALESRAPLECPVVENLGQPRK
jgi:DNA-binding transcriptional MerR regulator